MRPVVLKFSPTMVENNVNPFLKRKEERKTINEKRELERKEGKNRGNDVKRLFSSNHS